MENITSQNYIANVVRTESVDFPAIRGRLMGQRSLRILHALMGIGTESGELQDQLKKHLFYGKPLDSVNLVEEAGDLLWYVGVLLDALGVSFDDALQKNIEKLRQRYPEKFESEQALNRDLAAERQVLEGNA